MLEKSQLTFAPLAPAGIKVESNDINMVSPITGKTFVVMTGCDCNANEINVMYNKMYSFLIRFNFYRVLNENE